MTVQHTRTTSANQILSRLSESDQALLRPHLQPITFEARQTLEHRNRKIDRACFISDGLISILATGNGGATVELALVGSEGVTGVNASLGASTSSFDYYALTPGMAHSIGIDDLRGLMRRSPTLNRSLTCCANSMLCQVGLAVVASAHGRISERMARWLLTAHDRIQGDEIFVSHELIAQLLGVRRAGITETLGTFEAQGLISLERGCITVIERDGLIAIGKRFYVSAEM